MSRQLHPLGQNVPHAKQNSGPDVWRPKKCRGYWSNDMESVGDEFDRSSSDSSIYGGKSLRRWGRRSSGDRSRPPAPANTRHQEALAGWFNAPDHTGRGHHHKDLPTIEPNPLSGNDPAKQALSMMATRGKHSPRVKYERLTPDLLSQWLAICVEEHQGHCQRPLKAVESTDGRPLWLYNVDDECLVADEGKYHYAALSYVWGQVNMLHTLKENLTGFCEPHGLKASLLCPTIQHAIWLTAKVGIRHLWVDCLCLVQDDPETKHAQIGKMASIYANAFITLIAAIGGDANAGIAVVSELQDYERPLRVESCLGRPKPGYGWVERGWTMQELLFSRRKILLFNGTVSWECCCIIRHASLKRGEERSADANYRDQLSSRARTLQYTTWPDLEEYARLVYEYNCRHLSFSTDVFMAFHGVMTTFGHSFDQSILYGLPEMFFNVALLWQPFGVLKRRQATCKQNLDQGNAMPSWSWMGWQGELDPRSWACGYEYVHSIDRGFRRSWTWKQTSWKVLSTVKWLCGDAGQKQRRPIECTSLKYRSKAAGQILPPGWKEIRENATEEPCFVHKTDTDTKFRYPIPIRDPTYGPDFKLPTPLLFCRTRRAILQLGSRFTPPVTYSESLDCTTITLVIPDTLKLRLPQNYPWVGCIRLNEELSRPTSYQRPRTCVLVEISAGSAEYGWDESTYLEEWLELPQSKKGQLYEFYNVLWVERIDGIAYRKALGRVVKEVWEAVATETIDLVLG